MTNEILIVGSSVRAAAQSARRAGLDPFAVDSFADVDLQATCRTEKVGDYPNGLISASELFPKVPWMYTGAIENYPDVIQSISRHRRLLGNSDEIVGAVRDPWRMAMVLKRRLILYPEIRRVDETLPDGPWVRKPLRSGGGFSIHRVLQNHHDPSSERYSNASHYYQRFIAGESVAAIFVSDGQRAALLGMTQQRTRGANCTGNEFVYAGSIGPLIPSASQHRQLEQIGQCLVDEFRLTGLFGVDMILCDDSFWVIEVNPRYTASIELLERALGLQAIQLHVAGCTGQEVCHVEPPGVAAIHGKAIVYAQRHITIRPQFLEWVGKQNRDRTWPLIADIPAAGSMIKAAHPICTVFASGKTVADVERGLKSEIDFVQRQMGGGQEDG